jgi:hypothetical protein
MTTEPQYSFQLARGLLKAMALFQADEDRPQLACTCFEIRKTAIQHHELTLIATEGRRLATYRDEILQETLWGQLPDEVDFIVDLSGCSSLPKVDPVDYVTVEVFEKTVEFVADKIRYTAQRLEYDGTMKYPNWRGVLPAREPDRVDQISVNHEMLADFGKAAKLFLGEKGYALALRTFGEGAPISVQFMSHAEFYGLIMPLKSEHPESVPDWMQQEKKRGQKITKADLAQQSESEALKPAA